MPNMGNMQMNMMPNMQNMMANMNNQPMMAMMQKNMQQPQIAKPQPMLFDSVESIKKNIVMFSALDKNQKQMHL